MPPDVQFKPVGGGATPAREVPLRGPTQEAFLEASYLGPYEAADRIDERSQAQAQRAVDMYDAQAAQYIEQQHALERQQARRAQDFERLRADYDQTVQRLGEFQIDNNRLWANSSTMDKIGAGVLMFLGGAVGGDNNKVEKAIDDRMREDVELQQAAYKRGLDVLNGQKTAYGLAMEQYNSEDAAYHAAMAAAQQATAAKIAGMEAQWRGTDAANQADMLRGSYLEKANRSRAEGYKFLQPGFGSPKYKMFIRGQEVPGLVSEDKAQTYTIEHGVKPAEQVDLKMVEGGIQSTIAQQKAQAEAAAKGKENAVVLPNGETIYAPNPGEAGKMIDAIQAANETKALVAEAKRIRSDAVFRASPAARGRLEQIQQDLLEGYAVQHNMGALSDTDFDIAQKGTANLFNFGDAVEARLDRLYERAVAKVASRAATYPGTSAKSSGKMPGSFTAHGKK
jgi:hypothetical protein